VPPLRPPTDPPEKWRAFEAATEDDARTHRMARLVLASSLPWAVAFVLLGALGMVLAAFR